MRHATAPRSLALVLAGLLLLPLAACGGAGLYAGDGYVEDPYLLDPYVGSAELDNLSYEYVLGFYMAPAATTLYTGNLLSGPLPPGGFEYVGDFDEDLYDAEADLELGDLVQWFDVLLYGGELTTFEVY